MVETIFFFPMVQVVWFLFSHELIGKCTQTFIELPNNALRQEPHVPLWRLLVTSSDP